MKRIFLIKIVIFFIFSPLNIWTSNRISSINEKINNRVDYFNNESQPLIQTLFLIAKRFELPLGIEQVTSQSINTPIKINLSNTKVLNILDECMKESSGFEWKIQDNMIFITGKEAKSIKNNLFSFVIRDFSIKNSSLNEANYKLRIMFISQTEKNRIILGSVPSSLDLEGGSFNLNIRESSIRDILNKLVGLHGKAIWISRVPPENLNMEKEPSGGLWTLKPVGHSFTKQMFEPPLNER